MDKTSLLPGNLGELERDLDAAIARMEDIKIPISTLWDPWNCPIELLPWLAWAVSVDSWRSDWPEDVRRRVVANSLDLHRIKGTRPAVELAIESLGLDYRLIEWFQESPKAEPGTFKLDIYINDDAYSVTNNSELEQVIDNAKNVRSHLRKINLNLSTEGTAYIGCKHLSGETSCIYPWQLDEIRSEASNYWGTVNQSSDVLALYPADTVSIILQDSLAMVAFFQGTDVIFINPGVN
ncbi:phage tail protein I [Vibrio splendidus]|uniref:Phage tail fiber protein n=4 Tax=Vibrionaceae TaxID=641 RepID=A0A0H4A0Z9_9VIBR|nr:Phage tail fiber protein [Vibrio sp. FF_304]AKN36875.1 Phage tail fiber protein [Enterovibrio norvegicus]AKN38665.1 Phage tail fiber protein [Vibrio sp. F12 FF_152]AKN39421.1 Phage tail fiber protein [Vibrio tasmaniensis]